jgi:hypothetical protein
MSQASLEQAVRNAIKEEIGDEENVPFPRKNQILQKFGAIPTVVLASELKECYAE